MRLLHPRHHHDGRSSPGAEQSADESDIRTALNECLCRCGAYVRIVRAVQRAAEMSSSTRESA